MVQTFHRYGLRSGAEGGMLPFARLPIPVNPAPEPIRYADLRALFERWIADLAKAEATLAKVDSADVKLPLHFGLIRLDLNGDGKAEPDERLFRLYSRLNAAAGGKVTPEAAKEFIIAFDRADVAWLRGYCHLLMAMSEVYLAHDAHELFDHTAPYFYPKAETPFPFLRRSPNADPQKFETADFLDAIAFVHLVRFPVQEPARLKSALAHLESMIALSRESWKFILAEADDDHEWVPNTKQHSVIPNGNVTHGMVKGWLEFLDEAKAILKGEKLIPFWRIRPGKRCQPLPGLHRPTHLRPGPLGPGHRRHAVFAKWRLHQRRNLEPLAARLPRRIHRLRPLVQLRPQNSKTRTLHWRGEPGS